MNFKQTAGIYLRGVCMGTADLVPGVSGGTVAFISGIYHRLLAAIAVFSQPSFWRELCRFRIAACWRLADATFLSVLFAGILTAVLTLADLLHHLLATKAHLLLGFFAGLVVASVYPVYRRLTHVRPVHVLLGVVLAALTAWTVTITTTGGGDSGLVALFFGGMVAICAMLLPGISGSYILLILGLYSVVIDALHERDIVTVIIFAAGCGIGLILFSRLLAALLARWQTPTLTALIGVMIGALPKLWPWKAQDGDAAPILRANVMPGDFGGSPDVAGVIALAIVGAGLVLLLDRLTRTPHDG